MATAKANKTSRQAREQDKRAPMVIYALEAAGIEFEELREELSGKLGIRLTKRGLIEKLIRAGSIAIRKEFGLKEKKQTAQSAERGEADGK